MNRKILVAIVALPIGMTALLAKSASAVEVPSSSQGQVLIADRYDDHRDYDRDHDRDQHDQRVRQEAERREAIRREEARREELRREELRREEARRDAEHNHQRRVWVPEHWQPGFLGIGGHTVPGHWEYQ